MALASFTGLGLGGPGKTYGLISDKAALVVPPTPIFRIKLVGEDPRLYLIDNDDRAYLVE